MPHVVGIVLSLGVALLARSEAPVAGASEPNRNALRDERAAMQALMQDLARGAFTYAPSTLGQLSRAMAVDRRFADLRLGLVDASIMALAESLGIRRLATRDVRRPTASRREPNSGISRAARETKGHCRYPPRDPDAQPTDSTG